MPAPRLCVSVPVHEQPAVVLDQVENLRAFLPDDTQIVLHLSRSLGVEPADVAPLLPDGVHVNPRSHATVYGDIAHVHNDNVRFAFAALEPFDHVVLHASNDLYIRPGAERYVAGAQAGVHRWPTQPGDAWTQGAAAHRDPMLRAILEDLGAREIFGGLLEGSFFAADLFAEMLERMDRHLRPGAGEHYAREEVYYPTLAAHLATGPTARPFVYADWFEPHPPVCTATVYGLLDGTFASTPGMWDFDEIYAVKRVERRLHDPNRALIRTLSRATGRRLRLAAPFEARRFVALAFAADVLADAALLPAWHATFGAGDDVTLAIHVGADEADAVPALVRAAERGGSDAATAADVTLVSTTPGGFDEAALRWAVHALYRPRAASTPELFDEVPRYAPETLAALPPLVARRLGAVAAPA